jgi:hypothetical protein
MKRSPWTAVLLFLAACQTMNADADVPAMIVDADDASRAALRAALADAFGGREVVIADDALSTSSVLTIERGPHRTISNPTPDGRVLADPFRFRLVRRGDDCVLIDLRDESRRILADTRCAPE